MGKNRDKERKEAKMSDERDKVVQEMAMFLKKRLIFVFQISYRIEL